MFAEIRCRIAVAMWRMSLLTFYIFKVPRPEIFWDLVHRITIHSAQNLDGV